MAIDGGLRRIITQKMKSVHWQSIESAMTGGGIPDLNGCKNGVEVWIECKATNGWTVKIRPDQVGWLERRARNGGRVFIAVRQMRGEEDTLWLLDHRAARLLAAPLSYRLDALEEADSGWVLSRSKNGPSEWAWSVLEKALFFPAQR